MAVIRIAKAALPGLVMPSVSIGDGSAEPHLVPLYCRHPLFWRSVTLPVPADSRTARRISTIVWLWRGFYAFVGVTTLLAVIETIWLFQDGARPWWPLAVRLASLLGMLVVGGVGFMLRGTPAGRCVSGLVEIRHVDPTAASEWVALNPPGAVLVSDWQGARFQPVQAP